MTTTLDTLETRLSQGIGDWIEMQVLCGEKLGFKSSHRHIYHPCTDCGKLRWVCIVKGKPQNNRCRDCYHAVMRSKGETNPNWKGGRYIDAKSGYVYIKLVKENFFSSMADKRLYVAEHRLVMAKYLNRCLLVWEIVHHRNSIKDDNRIENLQLLSSHKSHLPDTLLKRRLNQQVKRIDTLEKRVVLLEAENILLHVQLEVEQCQRH